MPGGGDTRSVGEYQTGKSVITSDNGRYSVIVNKNKGKMSQEELNTIDKEFRKFYDECDKLVAEDPVYGEEIKELDNKLDSDNSFGMDEYKQEKEILRSRYMNDHIDYATERVGGILERHNIKLYYI